MREPPNSDEPSQPGREDGGDRQSWLEVRDSWVGDRISDEAIPPVTILEPPASDRPRTAPPPLPPSDVPPPSQDPVELERRERRIGLMLDRLAASDHEGALLAAEAILAVEPQQPDAVQCADIASRELLPLYESRLGSLDAVVRLAPSADPLDALRAPPDASAILPLIDGVATCRQIAERSRMRRIQALRILSELVLRGSVEIESA